MRYVAPVAALLLLGLIVWSQFRETSGEAVSAAPGTQTREDQITMLAIAVASGESEVTSGGTYQELGGGYTLIRAGLDASHYPPSTLFQLEVAWTLSGGATRCVRLFDETAQAGVAGSEMCHTTAGSGGDLESLLLRSKAFSLPAEFHEYGLEGKCGGGNCAGTPRGLSAARIVANWQEPSGATSELPPTGGAAPYAGAPGPGWLLAIVAGAIAIPGGAIAVWRGARR